MLYTCTTTLSSLKLYEVAVCQRLVGFTWASKSCAQPLSWPHCLATLAREV